MDDTNDRPPPVPQGNEDARHDTEPCPLPHYEDGALDVLEAMVT